MKPSRAMLPILSQLYGLYGLYGLYSLCGLCALPGCMPPPGALPTQPETVATPGPSAQDLYERGQQHATRGDLLRAEQYLSLAVRAGYPASDALPSLIRVCLRASRLRAALMHAQPVLSANPKSRRLRYLVATLHLGLGQHRLARPHLVALSNAPQPHPEARELLRGMTRRPWSHPPRTSRPPSPHFQETP